MEVGSRTRVDGCEIPGDVIIIIIIIIISQSTRQKITWQSIVSTKQNLLYPPKPSRKHPHTVYVATTYSRWLNHMEINANSNIRPNPTTTQMSSTHPSNNF